MLVNTMWFNRWLLRLGGAPVVAVAVLLDRFIWPLRLRLQGVRFGAGLRLCGCPVIGLPPGGAVTLGRNVTLVSRRGSNPLPLHAPCSFVSLPGAEIVVGDGAGLSGTVIVAATSVNIGQRTLVGANCVIIDT